MTTFVSRADWGHTGDRGGYAIPGSQVDKLVCHHTPHQDPATYAQAIEELHQVLTGHLFNGWGDGGYSWLVWHSFAFEMRGYLRTGAHAPGANSTSIGIAFLMDGRYRTPTATEWQSARDVMAYGVEHGYCVPSYTVSGHRDHVATACPGDLTYSRLGDYWSTPIIHPAAPTPKPPEPEELDVYNFYERGGASFPWRGFERYCFALDSAIVRKGDVITVSLTTWGRDRNVKLLPPSGRDDDGTGNLTRRIGFGRPGVFVAEEEGWHSMLVEEDGRGQVRVEARLPKPQAA